MFCPKCRTEYREGFCVCSDCNTDLVGELSELPEEGKLEFIEYVEVMGTYNPADAALIKSILDLENITYYFNADHSMQVSPLAEPVRLMVKKDEVEKAKELLQVVKVYAAYEQAGRELAREGRIRHATQRRANQEIIPVPFFGVLKRLPFNPPF